MAQYKVTNIDTSGTHYLIHVFFKDFTSKEIHVYNTKELNKTITDLHNDKKVEDYAVYLKVDITTEENKTLNKSDLHFIGHLRGIDQYEVCNVKGYELALVLKLGDKYYLSFAESEDMYNTNIAVRIHDAYDQTKVGMNTDALGEEVFING